MWSYAGKQVDRARPGLLKECSEFICEWHESYSRGTREVPRGHSKHKSKGKVLSEHKGRSLISKGSSEAREPFEFG